MTPEKTHDSLREKVITKKRVYQLVNVRFQNKEEILEYYKNAFPSLALLNKKLYDFISQSLDSAYSAGIQNGLEIAVGAVKDNVRKCSDDILGVLEKLKSDKIKL